MSTRSIPGGTWRCRPIQVAVISAATVILRTATSDSKGASIWSSTRRSAGAARVPVTNRTRRIGGLPGGRKDALRSDTGSSFRMVSSARPPDRLPRIPRPDPFVRRSLQGASLWTPECYFLDFPGQFEVLVGDSTCSMVLQLHDDPSPGHRKIGVMVGRLGQIADGVHQHQRCRPAVGFVHPPDPAVLVVPTGQLPQPLADLVFIVGAFLRCRHDSSCVVASLISRVKYLNRGSLISREPRDS